MLPEPWLRVIVPTGRPSRVTHSWVPLARFTFLTLTDRVLKPPQPENWVSFARAVPLGTWPLNAGPVSASLSLPPVWQGGPGLGAGGLVTVSENVPVAVAPAESVTVTVKVWVPSWAGAPSSSPDGRGVSPA